VANRLTKQGDFVRREDGMFDRWYYTHAGQTLGPVTTEQLRQLAGSGRLVPDDLIWPEGRKQSEALPAQASIDFQTTSAPIEKKPAWLDDLRAAAQADPGQKPANPAKPVWLNTVRTTAKDEEKPVHPAKSNWLDDVGAAEKEEREKDKQQRSRPVEQRTGDQEGFVVLEPVTARPARTGDPFHKVVQRSKTIASAAVLLFLSVAVGISLLAWYAVQRERDIHVEKENAWRQAETIEGYVRKATSAIERGAWREALANYDEALNAGHPDPAGLRLSKARAFLALNDEESCQREMDALASLPNLGQHESSILLLRGEMLLGCNDPQAEQLIRQALGKKTLPPGEDAYARALLADTTPKAIDLLREALALDPYQLHARASLEFLLVLLARFDEARAELKAHTVLFPDDREAKVIQALLLAAEAKPAEARKALDGLRGKLLDNDLAAMRDVTMFLAELRNPHHRFDPNLGLPDLFQDWQALQPALRHLWPSLLGFAPGNGYALFSRLPPRLRKSLQGIPELLMTVAGGLGNAKKAPKQTVESITSVVEVHPEGTLMFVQALALWGADQWPEADLAAIRAVETPALVSIRRPALSVAAVSKAMMLTMFKNDNAMPLRAVEALFVPYHPAFFSASLEVASEQTLLFTAVENLRETLALGPYRPLLPEIAVRLAIAAREYNLARQLLGDWGRDADAESQLTILSLRAKTELRAGAYGPALGAATEYLRRKPDDSAMRHLREDAKNKLIEQARRYMSAKLEKRAP
jgi:tetratricopeptide (TPR) repeat protein